MRESLNHFNESELLTLIPAGGLGTRLGKLTSERAKPSLAISFEETGEVTRMIDIPLRAVREMGGAAIVSTCFAAETLDFVKDYDHVRVVREKAEGLPVDTLLANYHVLENSRADHIAIIPGDTCITGGTIEEMRRMLDTMEADAVLLATRHLEGHNVRPVDDAGIMCMAGEGTDSVGDLGIHILRREWLLERLLDHQQSDPEGDKEIWEAIYNVSRPSGRFYLHVPEHDLIDVDMGTLPAFRQRVIEYNRAHMDANRNIVFPGAVLPSDSTDTIAFPNSHSPYPLNRAMLPERTVVKTPDDYMVA